MSKIPLPAFTVFPDSNALYSPDVKAPVAPGFMAAWKDLEKGADLKLVVPAIVKDEIISRRVFVASCAISNAAKSMGTVTAVTGISPKPLPSLSYVRRMTERQFVKWCKSIGAETYAVPHATISWKQILRDAVTRVPPFSPHSENNEAQDKGFKDAVILKCLEHAVAKLGQRKGIFITKDGLLMQAFDAQFKSGEKCQRFDTLKDFSSYLRLLKENKKTEIAKAIQQNAAAIFYTLNDGNSLYAKYAVYAEIRKRFGLILDSDREHPNMPNFSTLLNPPLQPVGEDKLFLRESLFKSFDDATGFLWSTNIEMVKLFTNVGSSGFGTLLTPSNDRIRITKIAVIWRANIDAKAQFSGAEVVDYDFLETKLASADTSNRAAYGYPILQFTPQPPDLLQNFDLSKFLNPPKT